MSSLSWDSMAVVPCHALQGTLHLVESWQLTVPWFPRHSVSRGIMATHITMVSHEIPHLMKSRHLPIMMIMGLAGKSHKQDLP